jgi:hypothetical protein
VGRKNYFIRYLHAFRDTYFVIRDWIKGHSAEEPGTTGVPLVNEAISKGVHPDLGMIDLNGQVVPMRFIYWNQHATSEQLLSRDEWKTIRLVMAEFRAMTLENEIVPIVVFIPTKTEVYGSLFSEQSGQGFLLKIHDQLQFEMNTAELWRQSPESREYGS